MFPISMRKLILSIFNLTEGRNVDLRESDCIQSGSQGQLAASLQSTIQTPACENPRMEDPILSNVELEIQHQLNRQDRTEPRSRRDLADLLLHISSTFPNRPAVRNCRQRGRECQFCRWNHPLIANTSTPGHKHHLNSILRKTENQLVQTPDGAHQLPSTKTRGPSRHHD